MNTCAWVGCDDPAVVVCRKHRKRSYRAGERAARGASRRQVVAAVSRARGVSTADRLDELEFLIGGGVWLPDAAARVGWSAATAERRARDRGYSRVTEAFAWACEGTW